MEVIIGIIIIGIALKFMGGMLTGAETAANGCGKIIGFVIAGALIIALIFGLL